MVMSYGGLLNVRKESNIIFKSAIIRACNLAYMIISTSIAMWLVLTIHTSTGGTITTRQAFTVLSLLTSLRLSSYFFVLGLLGYSEGRVAIHRIQVTSPIHHFVDLPFNKYSRLRAEIFAG